MVGYHKANACGMQAKKRMLMINSMLQHCFAISSLRSPANDNVFSLIRPLDTTFSANEVYSRVAIQLSLFSERLHANNLSLIRRSLIITGAVHYRETIATSMF